MLNSHYFYYRQQITKRGLSKDQEKEKEIREKIDQNSFLENTNTPINLDESAEVAPTDVQSEAAEKENIKQPVGNSEINGFEQVAPGVFQFKQNWDKAASVLAPPQNYPVNHLPSTPLPKAPELEEPGFLRVDGIPGPYEHYQTPVYQFT